MGWRKRTPCEVVRNVTLMVLFGSLSSAAQVPSSEARQAADAPEDPVRALAQQVQELNATILELRSEISQSRRETREVRGELQRVLDRLTPESRPAEPPPPPTEETAAALQQTTVLSTAPERPEERFARLEESQQLLNQRIEEQYQTKVESASRYRTKLSGLVLLNAFANRGHVDSQEVPRQALQQGPDDAGGLGLTALQSELGFETYGPTLAGGRVSAGLRFDFFGVPSDTANASAWGAVRLRTAAVRMDWAKTSVVVGQDVPFFSPLSPTSIASFGYPGFSYSGNLWSWTPQARIEHRLIDGESNRLSVQGGFLNPVRRRSRQPAYGTRLAWSHGDSENALALGIGAYYSDQNYRAGRSVDGWAGTADWNIPLGSRLTLSGEFYRGRALGSFGGAQGRSVLFSGPEADPASEVTGLNAIGGWTQLKFRAAADIEFHAAYGADHPFRRDLRRVFSPAAYADLSKNRSGMFNVLYWPRTDLLFSLEYRRLDTLRINSERSTAGHLNLGVGVLF